MRRNQGTEHSIKEKLIEKFIQVVGTDQPLDLNKSFLELGMNSIMAVDFVEAVNDSLDLELGVEVIFDFRGIPELAEHIEKQYFIEEKSATSVNAISDDSSTDIAIIGIAGKFADSENIEELWTHLKAGDCCVKEIQRPGWDEKVYFTTQANQKNRSVSKWGGMLSHIDQFDADFFDISTEEAERMDPQQRICLEETYKAFEDADYPAEKLAGKKVGVFIGGRTSDYRSKLKDEMDTYTFWGNEMSMLASRISYFFNFKGPCLTVDTACSSSLVAIHLACDSICKGESEMALAGGVFIASTPEFFKMSSQAGLLSPEGQCKAFDPEANGMVLGEGAGMAVLKRLDAAVRDQDHIYGVIKGSAINQAGKTNGMTAPSVASQKQLIKEVYTKSQINPETIGYIEAHGTGTVLGDRMELKAFSEVFEEFTDKTQYCVIGSHKPNIGHATLAAGMAGLFKILMAMKNQVLPPNRLIELDQEDPLRNSPFVFNTTLTPWKASSGTPLRAGLNALGSNGTNAHIIIEEWVDQSPQSISSIPKPYYLFLLSAKNIEALRQKLVDLAFWIKSEGEHYSAEEVAYTLSVARSHYDVRCTFIASNLTELRQQLFKVIEAGLEEDETWCHRVTTYQSDLELINYGQQLIHTLSNQTILHMDRYQDYVVKLSELYVQGHPMDWTGLYQKNRKVPLPPYPFCRTSYWVQEKDATTDQEPTNLSSFGLQMEDMEELLTKLLLRQLQSLGILNDQKLTLEDMQKKLGLQSIYAKWLKRSLQFLMDNHCVFCDESNRYSVNPAFTQEMDDWEDWERKKQYWLTNQDAKAQTILVEHTLRSLPRILTGEILATDIMFPNSSMELVEGIYQNNDIADYFNNILAQKVVEYIQELLHQDPNARIRIIEIGAGTGATSSSVLKNLEPYRDNVEEYCYTDISKAFLVYAEKRFKEAYPFVNYAVYNVEAEALEQGIRIDTYDIAIATNVFHATKEIAQSLQQVKAVLKKDGMLILNELSENSLFLHLTFGLLEGWWLFQDDTLRLSGGPAISANGWKEVLKQEGFKQVQFPVAEDHEKGQQIIMGLSDGQLRQVAMLKQPFKQGEQKQPAVTTVKNDHIARALKDWMAEHLSHALSTDAQNINFGAAFRDYGVDSISGINLIQTINSTFSLELGTTILFDFTTIDQLTDFLLTHYNEAITTSFGQETPSSMEETSSEQVVGAKEEKRSYKERGSDVEKKGPIAIVGISGRFANSENVHELWEHLSKGTNLVDHTTRWRGQNDKDETVKRWEIGSFIENIDQFDPFFFNISGVEANHMDPQQRLFLMACWQALEDAGYAGKSIQGRSCGVYVGGSEGDYHHLMHNYPSNEVPQAFWGNLGSVIPARIAYYLNLQGPAIAIDTACSSSLVAMHVACQGLWTGEIEMALAGGVSIRCTPELYKAEHQAGMLSPSGQCYTFDDRANGFVPGEGVGVVLLKRLEDALANGDHIYGVIRGSGINQDGTTNGITAPSLRSQVQLEQNIYKQFGINPKDIQMVEAHGTGTKLGDPIEYQALTQAFKHYTDKKSYCAIGSIKTNIGHTQMAAGIAGVIKVLLALKHRKIPPSLHFDQGNSNIEFKDSPFYVNTELKEWEVKSGAKRCAAVSSFGVSGTNAHMVIEEAPEVVRNHPDMPGYLLVLSARSEEALQKQAQQLIDYSKSNTEDVGNICYTLMVGRKHFNHRLACVVRNQQDMVAQLAQWLERKSTSSIFTHVIYEREQRELPALKKFGNHCIAQCKINKEDYMDNLSTVADLYVQGYELDYLALFKEGRYGRVPLPTYPFSLDRYWVPQPETAKAPTKEASFVSDSSQTPVAEAMGKSAEETRLMTFAENWQQQELPDERWAPPKVWVCFLSDPSYQSLWRTGLQTRYPGTEVIFIAQGPKASRENAHSYQLPREDGAAYRQTLQRIAADWGTGFALLYLWPLEEPHFLSDYRPLFHLFQATQEAKPARFVWAGEWTSPLERSYLESWMGWERSLGFLFPQMEVAGILQKATSEALDITKWLDRLADELGTPDLESVLYDGGKRHVCRIKSTDITEGEGQIQEGGTYLITGGGGGLGRSLAVNLTRSRSVNLVLTGRSPLSDSLAAEIKQWEETGSQVVYCQADVCDRAAMEAVLAEAKNRFGGIDGVIHTAGVASTAPLLAKSAADFAHVLAPKVQGVQVLDEVFASESLDFVCYFSSSSAILGDMGAGDYAIANRFLLAYADQRQAIYPGKTLVIHWPLWKEGGMGLGDEEQTHLYLASSGQRALETEEGFALFERLLGQSSTQHLVLAGQPERVYRFLGINQPETVEPLPKQPDVLDVPAGQGRREEMKGLSVPQCVEWDLKEIASQLLQIPRHQLQVESNLADFGFDSITLATFAEQLTDHYQVEITPALFFGYPTLGKLTDYYMTEHKEAMADFYREGTTREKPSLRLSTEDQPAPKESSQPVRSEKLEERKSPSAPQVPAAPTQPDTEPIAVIGMSGRFPGARNIAQLWERLVQGEEQVQPTTRWSEEGEPWRLGMVPGVREFDPTFFGISPREAQNMDPRQRLLLQEAWKALEDAGYGEKQLARQQIGMFVGVENGDYQYLSGFDGPITSNHDAILAARLSYVLNLSGPNMAINTACSSGLVGLHQACQSLRMGDCDTAIAAGVNLVLLPQTLEAIDQAGMLSPDGRCYAFDERANGMVPGEAVAAVVLKRLSQAQADQDPIYAVIRGSGMNYDGKTNGITAPNGVVQSQLYRSVYDRYGIDPETLSYIVTHGTGTRLGDPVEVNGLRDAFQSYTKKEGFCAITSTKTNFGHTFAASGLVSLISMVQALRHETIPASLHCEQENKYIQWENSPFYVNKTNQEWKDSPGKPRRGAVSAFGMSGTNVHLVVESYSKEERDEKGTSLPYYLLALSAKTEEALAEKVTDLIAYLEGPEGQKADLLQVSYTLLHGRQHFRHRYVVVVKDKTDALYLMKRFNVGESLPNSYRNIVSEEFIGQKVMELFGRDLIQRLEKVETSDQYQEIMQGLSNLYCQGYDIPWEQMWKEEPGRIHLPSYPFARDSYWVPTEVVEAKQNYIEDYSDSKNIDTLSTNVDDNKINETTSLPVENVSIDDVEQDSLEVQSREKEDLEELEEELADSLAEALYIDREMILPGKKFIELGLDSIVGVEWIKSLNKTYGIDVKATKVYDYPTIRDFAQYVSSELNHRKKRPSKQNSLLPNEKGDKKRSLEIQTINKASATSFLKGPSLPKQNTNGSEMANSPKSLGNPLFQSRYRCKSNYMAGSMAQGVASEAMVISMGEAELLSFFGSAGLDGDRVASHIQNIQSALGPHKPYGMCLIANMNNQQEEWEQARLFINHEVPFIEASAYSTITAPFVYARIKGIKKQRDGSLYFPRRIIGKCSRLEIAKQLMAPPPEDLVEQLLEEKWITEEEAVLSKSIPMVDDIALEADSGGHTDQGVLSALVPSVLALRKEIQKNHLYPEPILVGCGGGIGTPEAVASAFMMGADFVFTGSINQCTVESGAHDVIKELLSSISIHDTAVTAAGDMFEIGAKAQVVSKHTQFSNRANKLYELFMQYNSIEEIPQEIKQEIESHYFKRTFAEVWELVCEYKKKKNPQHLAEAQVNPRFKLVLIFKWYFAYCNRATLNGDLSEKDNFQIFCGPALGAFNQWVKGTPYEDWKNRHVVDIAVMLMEQAAEHLQTRYSSKDVATSPQRVHEKQHSKETDIAIVGISGQFPKADNIGAFWDNIINGRDCISEIPSTRWPIAHYYDTDPEAPGKSTSKWMGSLEDFDKFDPTFFNIPPVDAMTMDPQQRLFLESCWSCIEDAGIKPSDLSNSKCGVFAGCATSDYEKLFSEKDLNSRILMGSTTSILAARISYLLNLRGPALAIETACSSSLVAVAEACNSIVLGNSDMALAGGVCMIADPSLHIMTSKAGMLSQQGHCRTFDQQADGFVPGEGVGVVLLKRLSDAVRDKDTIYGVIKGWGVNQDGKTNGITAPNGQAQMELEKAVYKKFDINPTDITLVEAHGTGTKLGDPIEVDALTEAFKSFTTKKQYCALGSVKSNIGHLLPAAGIAGLIKTLMAIKHQTLPPTIHYDRLNEHIHLTDSPFYINTKKQPWKTLQGKPRCAAVSSFGFSGTNAHLVVEEYLPQKVLDKNDNHNKPNQPVMIVLSAKNEKQLKVYADRIFHFIQNNSEIDLRQLAYTLQVGRESMEYRMAFTAHSLEEVLQTLRIYHQGKSPSNLLTGTLTKENEKIKKHMNNFEKGQWQEAVICWIKGGEVNWKLLYGDNLPQRINLPTYPFERKSFWPKKNNQSSKKEPSVNTSPLPEELVSLSPKTKPSFSLTNTKQQELKQEQIQLPSLTNMPKWSDRQRVQALSQQTLSKIDQPVVEHQVSQYSEEDGLKLQDMLIDSLVQTLFMEETTVDINRNFYDMGLDSILGVEWMRLINKTLNLSLDATTLYDYPTIHELTQYIQSIHEGDQQPSTANGTLITELAESLAEIMYLDPSDIDEDVQFSDLGLDSILGVEWIRVLNKRYGVTMEATTLYDYPTLREFANWMQHQNKKDDEESVLLSSPTLEEILEKVEQGTLEMNKAYNLLQEYNLV